MESNKVTRNFTAFQKHCVNFALAMISILVVYWTINSIVDIVFKRSIYLMLIFSICAIIYPFSKSKKYEKISFFIDLLIIILTIICSIYVLIDPYSRFIRLSMLNSYDIIFGSILIIIALDIGRRIIGWTLTLVALTVLLYAFFGNFIPGHFGNPGFDLNSIVSQVYAGLEGFYGMASRVMILYVVPFILLGAFLDKTGGLNFFMNLAFSVTKKSIGGPAKAAIIGSALFGSISGIAVANVTATGVLTIPLMKKTGYQPYMAGAVEAAASTGGSIMPPVMGVTAFLMVEFTQIPYLTIIAVAAIPAILYYTSLYSFIHIRAKKRNIGIDKEKKAEPVKNILKKGWFYFFSIIIIIIIMLFGYPPNLAALGGIAVLITVDSIRRKNINFKLYYEAFIEGGKNVIGIGSIVGCIGIILAVVGMTGLGLKLSWILSGLSMEKAFFAIVLVGLIAVILGMGLPSSAVYIIIAIIAGPTLINMGFPLITAHLIFIWFSVIANVSPPVGVSAIVAAGIAGSNPVKTMFTAFILANGLFVIPFMFYYRPGILWQNSFFLSLEVILSILLGLIAFAAFCENYFLKKTKWFERIFLLLSAIAFYYPNIMVNLMGLIVFIFVIISQKRGLSLA